MGGLFDKERKHIKGIIKKSMIKISNHIVEKLTDHVVPVRTGRYVKSHVVQIKKPSFTRSAVPMSPPYPNKLSAEESAPIRSGVETKLKAEATMLINAGNAKIYFGNSAKYAHLVEFIGWIPMPMGGKTGPKFVFGRAALSTNLQKKNIISQVTK